MDLETVPLKLPASLMAQARRLAAARDITLGQLVRSLLTKEVQRHERAKTPSRADEQLVAALQALLARDMAEAVGWSDLDNRLACHGYTLRPAGGGLALHKRSCGARMCKASELGFAYRTLVRRFGAAMPGHPHGAAGLVPRPPRRPRPPPGDEMDVIEKF